ncbi:MAG: GC-type dockerin domain-anchored protein [Phycisphaerales bacterium]
MFESTTRRTLLSLTALAGLTSAAHGQSSCSLKTTSGYSFAKLTLSPILFLNGDQRTYCEECDPPKKCESLDPGIGSLFYATRSDWSATIAGTGPFNPNPPGVYCSVRSAGNVCRDFVADTLTSANLTASPITLNWTNPGWSCSDTYTPYLTNNGFIQDSTASHQAGGFGSCDYGEYRIGTTVSPYTNPCTGATSSLSVGSAVATDDFGKYQAAHQRFSYSWPICGDNKSKTPSTVSIGLSLLSDFSWTRDVSADGCVSLSKMPVPIIAGFCIEVEQVTGSGSSSTVYYGIYYVREWNDITRLGEFGPPGMGTDIFDPDVSTTNFAAPWNTHIWTARVFEASSCCTSPKTTKLEVVLEGSDLQMINIRGWVDVNSLLENTTVNHGMYWQHDRLDLNFDGTPDCLDRELIIAARGKTISDPEYILRADLNGNGTISDAEYSEVATALLQLCACPADLVSLGGSPPPDGTLTSDDLTAFLACYFGGDMHADIAVLGGALGADAAITADDLTLFLSLFYGGC